MLSTIAIGIIAIVINRLPRASAFALPFLARSLVSSAASGDVSLREPGVRFRSRSSGPGGPRQSSF